MTLTTTVIASSNGAPEAPARLCTTDSDARWFVNYTDQPGIGRTTAICHFNTRTAARDFARGKRGYIIRVTDGPDGGASFAEFVGDFEPSAQEVRRIEGLTGRPLPASESAKGWRCASQCCATRPAEMTHQEIITMARYAPKPAGSPLGKRIEALISASGYSRTGLASATGVPVTTLKRLVTEASPNPRLETLTALSKALGVSIAELLEGDAPTKGHAPMEREALVKEVDAFKEEVSVAAARGALRHEDITLLRSVMDHAVAKNAHGEKH